MKIGNSKKQLAKIISENGGWREGAGFAWFQGKLKGGPCHEVWFGTENSEPEYIPSSGSLHSYWSMVVDKFVAAPFANWHQTVLSRDEYFHLYPVAEAAPEPVAKAKPTIEQLAADYRNLKDFANRKQQEADDAKADAEAKLAELIAAGKALRLVLSVAAHGPEPELGINDWRDLRVGDEVECVRSNCFHSKYSGEVGVVERVDFDDESTPVLVRFRFSGEAIWCHEVAFLRRPTQGDDNA